jgi:hypothetical protein
MRHVLSIVLFATVLGSCAKDGSSPPSGSATAQTQPDGTVPAPGNCVAGEVLPNVSIVISGKSISPTFGIGSSECASLNGRGYIAFDYDPVLLDSSGPIEVVLDSDAAVTLSWPLGEPFTETSPRHWRSAEPTKGCSRLTVSLVSPSGTSSETVGADIRIGGAGIECPQRGLGPSEPIDTSVIITEAPDTTLAPVRSGRVTTTTAATTTAASPPVDTNP